MGKYSISVTFEVNAENGYKALEKVVRDSLPDGALDEADYVSISKVEDTE